MKHIHLTDNMEFAGYIGNTLADHEKQQIEEHLADCDDCRKFFVLTNDLLREPELPELEMITEAEAISVWNKIITVIGDKEKNIPTRNGKKDTSGIQPKKKEERPPSGYRNFVKWITSSCSELHINFAFAAVRSQPVSPVDYIHLIREFDDLKAEMFVEKAEQEKIRINISVFEGDETAKNVRLTFEKKGGGRVSRLLKEEREPFDNLSFGSYCLILKQDSQKKGMLSFKIDENGLYEQ
jgi:hypothetical protein